MTVVIAPGFPWLDLVSQYLNQFPSSLSVALAIQDLSPFPAGSYTGAVAAPNLVGLPVKYAILGHPERRRYFRETDQEVANKVLQALDHQIQPILCLGDANIVNQARALPVEVLSQCWVVYEELAAIGTGQNLSVDKVQEAVNGIKKIFGQIKVLYGGSVDVKNIGQYLAICEGVLVGTASLDVTHFASLVKAAAATGF